MNFDIPDITENGEKASAGGQRRKPRRIGALRLGDTLRAVSRHYTATLENKDEDKEAEFYSLSEGEEKASFYGMDVSVTGICIRKKKVAAIYVEMPTKDRDDFIKKLEEAEGSSEHANNMDIFADTVTSIFITIPAKGDSSFTTALMDSAEVKALSDNEAIKAEEEAKKGGLRHRIWKTYFDPVGRISRKAYLPKMLMVGAPAAFLLCAYLLQAGALRRGNKLLHCSLPDIGDTLLHFSHQPWHEKTVGYRQIPSVLLGILCSSLRHSSGRGRILRIPAQCDAPHCCHLHARRHPSGIHTGRSQEKQVRSCTERIII